MKLYRGITILVIVGKVFNRIILNRMKFAVVEKLKDNQAGFRANRSCIDQIVTFILKNCNLLSVLDYSHLDSSRQIVDVQKLNLVGF